MLIIMTGLPGTGKTSVSRELASELDAVVLGTDEIRKTVLEETEYSNESRENVYEVMFRIGAMLLRGGHHVIMDGTFSRERLRKGARRTGRRERRKVFLIETVLPGDIVRDRIEARKKEDADFSDADEEVYEIIRREFEPVDQKRFTIDTSAEETWKERTMACVNEMRVLERRRDVIDRLKRAGDMKLIQTHISWVLLEGTHAYKIKKPVHMSFVNYRTLERRRYFCEREVQVNSLLSHDLYRGVVPVRREEDRVSLDGENAGEVTEYAVKMVELPQDARMDRALRKRKVDRSDLEEIARILSEFHAKTAVAPEHYGSLETIRENFSHPFETTSLVEEHLGEGKTMEEIRTGVEAFLENHRLHFGKRVREERIRHCHGDVRTKNIFLHDGKVVLFDAIEFSEKISCCDVAAEIAFLAMDLDFYRKPDLSSIFVRAYIEESGDEDLRNLLTFYKCYRAMVQILVRSYTLADPEIGDTKKEKARRECRRYLELAASYAGDL